MKHDRENNKPAVIRFNPIFNRMEFWSWFGRWAPLDGRWPEAKVISFMDSWCEPCEGITDDE